MVHLHNGILCRRKKEGAPTLTTAWMEWESIMLSEISQVVKKEIPYDFTYKWNLINKTNKQGKYNQRHGNKEQIDSNQRGEGKERTGKKGKDRQGTCIKGPWTKTMGG